MEQKLYYRIKILTLILVCMITWQTFYIFHSLIKREQSKIDNLEQKLEKEPEKSRFAWDLARIKLEAYFDRNLNQVRNIFIVAVFTMAVGFILISVGIGASIVDPSRTNIALIASASGIITQFISVTFMVIYRSTMLQATQFMSVLERINTVGMSIQILDSMDKRAPELKDATRVDIIRLLLATPGTQFIFPPRSRKSSKNKVATDESSNEDQT